jgi:hypothetical protein
MRTAVAVVANAKHLMMILIIIRINDRREEYYTVQQSIYVCLELVWFLAMLE